MVKNTKLLIKSNIKTFLSILVLTLLGVGFFVGMKVSVPDLIETVDSYYKKLKMFDISLSSNLGFTNDDITVIKKTSGVEKIVGANQKDVILKINKLEYVVRIHSFEDSSINNLEVIKGRLPSNDKEIVLEEKMFKKGKYKIGDSISINNKAFKENQFKIVGSVKSPLYFSNDKGSTNLLSGKVSYYAYINSSCFVNETYNKLFIRKKSNYDIDNVINSIKTSGSKLLDKRYADTINELKITIDKNQLELDSKRLEYEMKIEDYDNLILNAELSIKAADESIPSVKEAQIMLDNRQNELNKVSSKLSEAKAKIDASETEYNEAKALYDSTFSEINTSKQEFANIISTNNIEIDNNRRKISDLNAELVSANDSRKEEINTNIAQLNDTISQLELENRIYNGLINTIDSQINVYAEKLKSAKSQLDASNREYNLANEEFQRVSRQLMAKSAEEIVEQAKKEVEAKRIELTNKKAELESEKKKALFEFETYQLQLDDAKDYLKLLSVSGWQIESRENYGEYNKYLNDIKRIENISNFFPVIFYIVAVLITITNITRIIEKDRSKIGLYKALGYDRKTIGGSYILFSVVAALFGSVIGTIIGLFILPKVFYNVYSLIYDLPKFKYVFDIKIIMLANLLAICLIVVSGYISITNTIAEWPVSLLRPKKVSKGKRVLLEKVGFIWNNINFTTKVTCRNVFKNPKIFSMTILGIAGCISLIIAGFNLRSSISNIIPLQYGKIFDVDLQVILRDSISRTKVLEEKNRINDLDEVDSSILVYLKYGYINDNDSKIYLVVPEDNDLLLDFVSLKDNMQELRLDDDGAIISRKYATINNIKIGDTVSVSDIDNNVYKVKISNITDNYVDNYLYMSKEYYNKLLKQVPKYNTLLIRTNSKMKSETDLSAKISKNSNVSYLIYTSYAKVVYDNLSKSLDYIVYVLVVSAIVLAFIVLYNINSLNISERFSEIATIKVLGFNKKEVYQYIENEIKILTVIGIILGVILGHYFSLILIKNCELDNLMYDYNSPITNYVYAILITILFMIITSLISRVSIRKINMVESLKQVE